MLQNKLKVGAKVIATFKKYNSVVFEGIIEEIKGNDISIRPSRCIKGNDMELNIALRLKVLLGIKSTSIIKVVDDELC